MRQLVTSSPQSGSRGKMLVLAHQSRTPVGEVGPPTSGVGWGGERSSLQELGSPGDKED